MELHFMFVLLRGAVGRILSLSPPLPPALRLVPSCEPGGSEQPFACSALRGLLQEWVFPSSACPPLGTDVLPCLGGAGMCHGLFALLGRLCRSPSPSLPAPKAPPRCVASQTPSCPAVRMGDSPGTGRETGWVQQPGTQTCRPASQAGNTPCPPQQPTPVPWGQQTQDGPSLL